METVRNLTVFILKYPLLNPLLPMPVPLLSVLPFNVLFSDLDTVLFQSCYNSLTAVSCMKLSAVVWGHGP